MKKLFISTIVTSSLLASTVFGQVLPTQNISINGAPSKLEVLNIDGRNFANAEDLLNAIGVTSEIAKYDEGITFDGITFSKDSDIFTVNGEKFNMDTKVLFNDGKYYLPIKYVLDGENINYSYNANTKTTNIVLENSDKPPAINPLDNLDISIDRYVDGPIIYPELSESIGENIQGPCLIKVPDWVENPLGAYYLYFADHKGSYIRLAYADKIEGPWTIYDDGSLKLSQTTFLHENPTLTKELEEQLPLMAKKLGFDPDTKIAHDLAEEAVSVHIASPSVYIDNENKEFVMYFHGLEAPAIQKTRVAFSKDGINFEQKSDENLGATYMRVFEYKGTNYAMSMPGQLYRSDNPYSGFEPGNMIFGPNTRHSDILLKGDTLYIVYSVVGDAPEQFYLTTVDVSKPFEDWKTSESVPIMKPEKDWEGADAPLEPSIRSTAYGHVNQIRDPFIYEEDGNLYILYAVAGESGIGVAKVNVKQK